MSKPRAPSGSAPQPRVGGQRASGPSLASQDYLAGVHQLRLLAATYPAVTSALWAAKAPRTSAFSRGGTLQWSRVRASSAASSSNSAGEIRRLLCAASRPRGVAPGLVAVYWNGPPAMLQTQS